MKPTNIPVTSNGKTKFTYQWSDALKAMQSVNLHWDPEAKQWTTKNPAPEILGPKDPEFNEYGEICP